MLKGRGFVFIQQEDSQTFRACERPKSLLVPCTLSPTSQWVVDVSLTELAHPSLSVPESEMYLLSVPYTVGARETHRNVG